MSDSVTLSEINASQMSCVGSDSGIDQEIAAHFTFYAEGYKFSPLYKRRIWDGKIRLFNPSKQLLPRGLYAEIEKFCIDRNYDLLNNLNQNSTDNTAIINFVNDFRITVNNEVIPLRDYQKNAAIKALSNKRLILISPTRSGKSAIIYCIIRYCLQFNKKICLVVPKVDLVEQMYSDFEAYSAHEPEIYIPHICHRLYAGKSKRFSQPVLISTWQTLSKMSPEFLNEFDVLIGDEAHTFAAKSLVKILDSMTNVSMRIGTTGTLNADNKIHEFTLQGMFGPHYTVISTQGMIKAGAAVPLKIKIIKLKYKDSPLKLMDYVDEQKWVIKNKSREQFIINLAMSQHKNQNGTVLVLFKNIAYGKLLYNGIANKIDDASKLHFIDGGIDVDDRAEIKTLISDGASHIIVASFGTTSTGTTLPSVNCIIFAQSGKSRIRNLQSLGRGLGLSDGKTHCTLIDIVDDLRLTEKKYNISLIHMVERLQQYRNEGHPVKVLEFTLT